MKMPRMKLTTMLDYGGSHVFRECELNDRLNTSEERLRKRIGKRKVDALARAFKAKATYELFMKFYHHPDPYRWLAEVWASRAPRDWYRERSAP